MTEGLEKDIRDYLQHMTNEIIEVNTSIGEIKVLLAVHGTKFEDSCKRLERVCSDLDGNGKIGLKQELRDHLSRHDERSRLITWMASVGSGGGVVGFITGMVALFR